MKLRKVLAGALALVMAVGTILVAPVESKAAEADTVSDVVGYYSFNDTLENAASTSNGTAKLHGGADLWVNNALDTAFWNEATTGTAKYEAGKVGNAYSFTGDAGSANGKRGEGLELDIKLPEAYTISYWVKPTTVTGATSMVFVPDTTDRGINIADNWFGATFPTVRIWGVAGTNDAYLDHWLPDPDGEDGPLSAAANDACGNWYYITLTCTETGALKLYIDGREVGAGTHAAGAFKDMYIYLGINFWDASFHGLMDEVTVYERALSADDVAALYANNGIPGVVTLSDDVESVEKNDTYQLTATVADGYTGTVEWSSSNTSVATVDNTGKVTVLTDEGTAVITATVGEWSDSCTITAVSEIVPLTKIEIKADKTEVALNGTTTLSVVYTPENTTDIKDVTWSTSDEKILTIDKDGNVKAVGLGKATITAKVGEFTDTVEITVPAVPATKLEASVEKTELNAGDSVQIKATVAPTDTTDVITYESSNGAVLIVDANGKVSAVKAGTATVTVKAGSLTKTFNFAVNETSTMELDDMNVEGWWSVHTPGIAIEAGKTYTFTFDAKSKSSEQAWFCPSYVVYSNSSAVVNIDSPDYKEYFVCRADNAGWSPNGETWNNAIGDGYTFETNAVPETTDWVATYKENMAAGTKGTVTAVLSGSNLIVVYDIAGVKSTTTMPVDTSKPLYIGLTGEQVDVTNLVVTSQTAIKATADILPVLPIVMLIVGCGVVVVASKKRFAK